MRRMLLTSSQVGIVLSTIIIVLFTTALFLAGYVLQQNTVAHLREAIKPKPLPLHTSEYYVDSNGDALPSAKEDAFPELLSIEIVNRLESDDGIDPKFDNALGWVEEKQEAVANEEGEAHEFEYQAGKLGASDDEASFAERRKADKAAAERVKSAQQAPLRASESRSAPEEAEGFQEPATETKAGPYLGSIMEETKKILRRMGKSDSISDAEELIAMDPKEMTTARRRKLFLEQLAKGKSPEVVKNPWEYRRRSWLQR